MRMDDGSRKRLRDAIQQVRDDLALLETHIPNWDSEGKGGTDRYRPLANQILAGTKRLEQMVREYTY